MSDLIVVVGEMVSAIKNPTHFIEILYEMVMEIEGFENNVLIDLFDHLQLRQDKAMGCIVKKMALRKLWIKKLHSQVEWMTPAILDAYL